jgi:hypothetical protein
MDVSRIMLQLFWSALFLGSGWMAVQSYRGLPTMAPAMAQAAWRDPPECRAMWGSGTLDAAPTAEELSWYPSSRYSHLLADVGLLARRADIEHAGCRGRGDDPETYRACNRRDCLGSELERRGWCLDGGESRASDRWMRCSDVPGYAPSAEWALQYPEEEIRRMFPPRASKLDVAFSNAEGYFFDKVGGALPPDNPLARMRREAEARLAACATVACRQQAEADLLSRLRFYREYRLPGDVESGAVPFIRLRTGVLRIGGDRLQGGVDILPLDGDEILVRVAPDPTEQIRRRCRGVVAQGRLGADGVAHMTSLDEMGLRFTLHITSHARIELRPIDGRAKRDPPLCAPNGTIFGYYDAVER